MREIRNLYRFIPFGKFSLSGRGKPPFNQVFVGREKERANFIELLAHQESFGAFLISGQRGAGKTSFVDYCLGEYEEMAFQRSIRVSRNTGFIGLLLLLAFSFVLISTYVLLTQFLELGAQNIFEAILAVGVNGERGVSGLATTSVVWMAVPFVLGSALMIFPIVLAYRTVSALSELCDSPTKRYVHLLWNLGIVFIAVALWVLTTLLGQALDLKLYYNVDVILYVFLWTLVPLSSFVKIAQTISESKKVSFAKSRWMTILAVVLSLFSGFIALLNLRGDENGADLSDLFFMMGVYGLLAYGAHVRGKKYLRLIATDLSEILALMVKHGFKYRT